MWHRLRARPWSVAAALLVVLGLGAGVVAVGVDGPAAGVGGSPPDDSPGETGQPTTGANFTDVARATGLNYTADAPASMIVNGGVYVLDFDTDGWPDLLAVGGDRPALFHNAGGSFERVERFAPGVETPVEGAHAFDFDADGDDDLLLLAQRRRPLLLENEDGRFEARPGAFPVNMTYPVGATSADVDGDGCLDVFVYQYADWAEREPSGVDNQTVPGDEDNGNPNYLFRGNCTATFSPVDGGAISGTRWTLAASAVDFTGDGRPDVHVANDFNYDLLYVNRGNGTFEQRLLGPATNRNAMSSEVGDVDGDGRPDVFVTNIYLPELLRSSNQKFGERMHGNNLLLNEGNGTFEDAAARFGLRRGGWGWAAVLADFDNDRDRELFHTTKRIPVSPTVRSKITEQGGTIGSFIRRNPYLTYPQYYERVDDGFVPLSAADRGFVEASGTGVARLDFDRDGDLDMAVAQVSGRFLLYETAPKRAANHWLRIDLRRGPSTPATGAEVVVTVDNRTYHRFVTSRADHLSQDSRVVHLGLGRATAVDRVRVLWPDGTETVLEDVAADRRIAIAPDGPVNATDG